ncbi:hypothetical protein [Haliscomenobacter sp.]|uniref:hypothetical protein n=1 Tax=Haliscomenobacter sp. TaxID=2717303 RepID=UPI0035945B29
MKNKLIEDVGEVLIELDSYKSRVSIVEEISIALSQNHHILYQFLDQLASSLLVK